MSFCNWTAKGLLDTYVSIAIVGANYSIGRRGLHGQQARPDAIIEGSRIGRRQREKPARAGDNNIIHIPSLIIVRTGIDGIEMETDSDLPAGESREVVGNVDPVSKGVGPKKRPALVVAGKHHKRGPVVGGDFNRRMIP